MLNKQSPELISSNEHLVILTSKQYGNLLYLIEELGDKIDLITPVLKNIEEERGMRRLSFLDVAKRLNFITTKPILKRIEMGIFPKPHQDKEKFPYYMEVDIGILKSQMKISVRV
jgi:hypothetical protein